MIMKQVEYFCGTLEQYHGSEDDAAGDLSNAGNIPLDRLMDISKIISGH
jgi:hypothetical protein